MGVTVKGLSSLEAKLKRLNPMTHAAIVRGVALAAAKVEGDAKTIVPVDTGHLRASISSNSHSTANGAEAEVSTNVEYAAYVEFGTSRQKAQPYLHPALQKNKANIRKIIIEEIVKAHKGL